MLFIALCGLQLSSPVETRTSLLHPILKCFGILFDSYFHSLISYHFINSIYPEPIILKGDQVTHLASHALLHDDEPAVSQSLLT